MTLIKSLFNQFFGGNNKSTATVADDYAELDKLRINHEWIEVSVIKTAQCYQSLILDIDLDNNELLIDELYPPNATNNIEPGDALAIRSQSSRTQVNFVSRILARELNHGEGSWRLELPESIGRNHSRNAFRIYVENEQDIGIDIYSDQQLIQNVRIINLSSEGIKLSFDHQYQSLLNQQLLFTDCIIRLPNDCDIDCHIELRNSYAMPRPKPHIISGGKLTIPNPQHRTKLQQYIASLQRKQLRHSNDAVVSNSTYE